MAKVKYFDLHAEAVGSDGKKRVVTLVGKLEQGYFKEKVVVDAPIVIGKSELEGKLSFRKKTFKRTLTIGMSICHTDDKFDEEYGINLAKKSLITPLLLY